MRNIVGLVLLSFGVLCPSFVEAYVKIVDGDSLEIDGKRARLEGIDAPEWKQYCYDAEGNSYLCGIRAKEELVKIVGDKKLKCDESGKDKYERALVTCYAGAVNINKEMVLKGWAVSYGDYKNQEKKARKKGRGIWQGRFMRPELFRALNRRK